MAYKKIDDSDLLGKGVINLADTPGLSAQQMQEKFEETSRSVIIPHFNQLIDTLTENGVPVKSEDIVKIKKDNNGDLLISTDGVNWVHSSNNALDKKADKAETYTKGETDHKLLLKADNDNVYSKKEIYTKSETEMAISKRVNDIGSSDMTKAVYDTTNNGIVDNSEKLGGHLPEYFATKKDVEVQFVKKTNENLDDYKVKGIYYFDNSHKPINPPPANTAGWLISIPDTPSIPTYTIKQIWLGRNIIGKTDYLIYTRSYVLGDNTWSGWTKILTDADKKDFMPITGGEFTGIAEAKASRGGGWNIKNNAVSDSDWNEVQENISSIRFIRK